VKGETVADNVPTSV